jgi:hypothetical protein
VGRNGDAAHVDQHGPLLAMLAMFGVVSGTAGVAMQAA